MATLHDIHRHRDEFFGDSFNEMVEKILDLREEISELRSTAADIAGDFVADNDEDAALALQEMREAVAKLGEGA